jgi:hypothetical protein
MNHRLDRYQQPSSITNCQQEYEEHQQHRQFRDENPRQSSTRMPSPVRNIYQRKRRTVIPRNEPRNEPRINDSQKESQYYQQASAPDETYNLSPTQQYKQQTSQDTERLQVLLEEQVGALQTLNDRMHRIENERQQRRYRDSIRSERETSDTDNTNNGPSLRTEEIDSLRRRFAKQQASIARLQDEILALSEKTKPARGQNEIAAPQTSLDASATGNNSSSKEKGWLIGALVVAGILVLLVIVAIVAYKCVNSVLVAKRATPSVSTPASTSFTTALPSSASLTNSAAANSVLANSVAANSIAPNSDRNAIASVASSVILPSQRIAPPPLFQPQPNQPYQQAPYQQAQQQFVPGYYVAMPTRQEISERNTSTWSDGGVGGGNAMLSASGRAALSASAMQILREQQRQDIREALHEAIASISFHHQRQVANVQTGSTSLVNVANALSSPLQSAQYGEVVLGPQ